MPVIEKMGSDVCWEYSHPPFQEERGGQNTEHWVVYYAVMAKGWLVLRTEDGFAELIPKDPLNRLDCEIGGDQVARKRF